MSSETSVQMQDEEREGRAVGLGAVREIMYNCERPAASVDDFCTSEQNAADSAHTRRVTSFHL